MASWLLVLRIHTAVRVVLAGGKTIPTALPLSKALKIFGQGWDLNALPDNIKQFQTGP